MSAEINFAKIAILEDLEMWTLCRNILVFLAPQCENVVQIEEQSVDNEHPTMNIWVDLLDQLDKLREEDDEFTSLELNTLKSYLEQTKAEGCKFISLRA